MASWDFGPDFGACLQSILLPEAGRRVVGWAMADHLRAELALSALAMALGQIFGRSTWSVRTYIISQVVDHGYLPRNFEKLRPARHGRASMNLGLATITLPLNLRVDHRVDVVPPGAPFPGCCAPRLAARPREKNPDPTAAGRFFAPVLRSGVVPRSDPSGDYPAKDG